MSNNKKVRELRREARELLKMIEIYKREHKNIKNIDDAIKSYFVYNKRVVIEMLIKYCSLYGFTKEDIGQRIWELILEDKIVTYDNDQVIYV